MVERVVRRAGLALEEVDIETDDRLVGAYGLRIPVVLGPDGTVLAEGRIDDGTALYRSIKKTTWSSGRWPRRRRPPR